MSGIKYYALDENEEVPYEFVVIRNVNGEPEFCASFVNTNSLAYGNGVLLKLHQRNDELRAKNAKLRKLAKDLHILAGGVLPERKSDYITICSVEACIDYYSRTMPAIEQRMRELGIEV